MSTTTPPRLSYTARDFETVLAELQSFTQATRPQDASDFATSNLGTLIHELMAIVADINSYGQDIGAQELFLPIARRYESALDFARAVGYVPRSAVAASVSLVVGEFPALLATNGGVIAKGSFVSGDNGLQYEVVAAITIPAGQALPYTIPVKEGTSYSQSFEPSQAPSQEFRVDNGIVENDSWEVYIGDATVSGNKWTQVNSVLLELSDTKTYQHRFDELGRLYVRFGDGAKGEIPRDTVTIAYRTTSGEAGNDAPINSIKGSFSVAVTGSSTVVSIESANSGAAANGGVNRESIAELRDSIPAYLRTADKISSIDDYEAAARIVAGVELAYADKPTTDFSINVMRVHVWDTESVSIIPASSIISTVTYLQYKQASATTVKAVQAYLAPRTLATVHNLIIRPTVALVELYFGTIAHANTHLRETVHKDVAEAVVSVFEGLRFTLRLSSIYTAVSNVSGVNHFAIEKIVFRHLDPDTLLTRVDTYYGNPQSGQDPLQDLTLAVRTVDAFYDESFQYINEITFAGDILDTVIEAINLSILSYEVQQTE